MRIIKYNNLYFDEILSAFVEFQDKTKVEIYDTSAKTYSQKREVLKKILSSLIYSSKFCFLVVEKERFCAFYCFSKYLEDSLMLDLVFVNPKVIFSEKILNSFFEVEKQIAKTKYENKIFARLYKRKNFKKYVSFVLKHLNFKKIRDEKKNILIKKM